MVEALELRVCFLVGKGCDEAVREIGSAGTTGCLRLTTIVDDECKGNAWSWDLGRHALYLDLFTRAPPRRMSRRSRAMRTYSKHNRTSNQNVLNNILADEQTSRKRLLHSEPEGRQTKRIKLVDVSSLGFGF